VSTIGRVAARAQEEAARLEAIRLPPLADRTEILLCVAGEEDATGPFPAGSSAMSSSAGRPRPVRTGSQAAGSPSRAAGSSLIGSPVILPHSEPSRMQALAQVAAWLAVSLVGLDLAGCSGPARELERVARDWCLAVRASQVLPVYPLTEDLQPGDVLLVTTPLERQAEEYSRRGFLPLDQHILRLHPDGYREFYRGTRALSDALRPRAALAPHAAFPACSFAIEGAASAAAAFRLESVEVGLALLGAAASEGRIAMRKVSTFGIDAYSLLRQLERWAACECRFLEALAPAADGKRAYLRLVTRVYYAGGVSVTLEAKAGAEASGVAAPAGAPAAARETPALPSARVRLLGASSRAVILEEDFPRPLVVGYLAVDVPIEAGGRLGGPLPTLEILEGGAAACHRGGPAAGR
jgi:hypothetical protein